MQIVYKSAPTLNTGQDENFIKIIIVPLFYCEYYRQISYWHIIKKFNNTRYMYFNQQFYCNRVYTLLLHKNFIF